MQRVFPDSAAALEGSIAGAASGIFAGLVGPILVGILSGQAVGDIVGKVLVGFVVGFGVGALFGAILGARVRRLLPGFRIEPGRALVIAGALLGSVVGLAVERFWWFPAIAGMGAIGANLWPLLWSKLDAAANPPKDTTLEDLVGERGRRRISRY